MAPTFEFLDRTLGRPCLHGSKKGTSEAFTPLVRLSSIRKAPLWTLGQAYSYNDRFDGCLSTGRFTVRNLERVL
jgi:hypothetical protein